MLKLSKRELTLVVALGVILLGIVYYKFIIVPQTASAQTFKVEREQKRNQLQTFRLDVASQKKLEIELLNLQDKIQDQSQRYFLTLDQEEIILILNEFVEGTKVKLKSVNFEEPRVEAVGESEGEEDESQSQAETGENTDENTEDKDSTNLDVHSVSLEYESDYYSLLDFLKNISSYHKKIMIKNININKEDTGNITGNTTLEFYVIGKIIEGQELLYAWEPDQGNVVGDPFLEFNGYTISKETAETSDPKETFSYMSSIKDYGEGSTGSNSVHGNSGNQGSSSGSNSIDQVKNVETRDLFDFEDTSKLLFAGNSKDIKGELLLDKKTKTQGSYSLNLKYDFVEERRYSVANLSFDNNVIIKEQPKALSLDVRPIEKSNCRLGITIRDREGNYYKLPLKETLDWNGWETLTVELPIDINYPAVVEKVYIESYDHYKKLTGSLLMDNMKLIYEN